jgi:hypothetical protein
MKKREPERAYDPCTKPEKHRDHLCLLMEKGLTEEVAQRTSHPRFSCRNCGARANDREDLCNPVSLGES